MLFLSALLACGPACFSQQAEKFPLGDYVELTDTKSHDGEEVWSKMTAPVRFCWGTTDVRYKKLNVPDVKTTGTLRLKAWKGACECTGSALDAERAGRSGNCCQ